MICIRSARSVAGSPVAATVDGSRRRAAISLVLGLGLTLSAAGCASGSFFQIQPERDTSYFGHYLAGRYAGVLHENDKAATFYAEALEGDPDNPVIIERAFTLAVTAGDMDRAVSLAEEIVKQTPDERTARLVLGLRDLRQRNYGSAIANLDGAAPGPFTALIGTLAKAWAEAGLGNSEAALAGVASFEGRPAFDLFRFYHEALVRDFLADGKGAEQAYRQAMEVSGGASLRVVQAYGNFLERQGRFEDAREIYGRYAVNAPTHPVVVALLSGVDGRRVPAPLFAQPADGIAEALYGLGSALAQENGIDIAILYIQLALYLRPDFDVARSLLADIYETDKRWEDAIAAYRRIPETSPLYQSGQIQIAINLDRLKHSDEALAMLRDMIKSAPGVMEPVVAMGDILRSGEHYEAAAEQYSHALELAGEKASDHWTLFYARGICYERLGRWPESERDLKTALQLSGEHPLVLNYLGYSWVDQNVHLEEAMAMIHKAVDLRPNDGFIVDSLGWAYYRTGDYAMATEQLERAVVLQPEDPTINDHLGDALWKVGRKLEARFQWRHALELKPEEKLIPDIQAKLDFGLDAEEAATVRQNQPGDASGS